MTTPAPHTCPTCSRTTARHCKGDKPGCSWRMCKECGLDIDVKTGRSKVHHPA